MTIAAQARGARFLVDEVEPDDVVCPEDMGEDERLLMRSIRESASCGKRQRPRRARARRDQR